MNGIHNDEKTKSFHNGGYDSQFSDDIPLPDFISGDFDSIKPHVKEFYSDLGVKIIYTPDQDKTDYTKALHILKEHLTQTQMKVSLKLFDQYRKTKF